MSSREKKLLSLLLIAGFIMLNFFLYSQYHQKKSIYETNLDTANNQLRQAISNQNNSELFTEQMQWLAENEPVPSNAQTVQGQLQELVEKEAQTAGLTLKPKSQEFIATDTTGTYYHRAQMKISVTGREDSLYRWLHVINDPASFRAATQIRLTPNTQNDELIDCTAFISQWFPVETTDS
jgi:hypothetical protein